ncbi:MULTISPECIES: ATP-dependent 6-phosphofructokinase [unclassified Pseudoalteromonas]|uniref:ATP-dependent 6-phosphofructokinase n=1 Tax=unclassified Pseudoalteromonas TaxID=194690 RepID=UPI00390C7895|nr:ATP-dependent 6-phosphofructokinase [Ningiella sp. W23]
MQPIHHIAVLTSGGDAPGMNTALFAIVKTAQQQGIKVSGVRKGYEGLIDNDLVTLDCKNLQQSMHLGGTVLKTARSERFRTHTGRQQALATIEHNNIDALIVIGGDGSFRGCLWLSQITNIPYIGIPGTIDNDIAGTDYTLGFDTAVNTSMQCIDNIRDTAESHNRVFVIEVMGRDSGYIGTYAGLTSGADSVLIPENDKDIDALLLKISDYHSEHAFIVVVSEGDEIGVEHVCEKITAVNSSIDLRVTKLGHLQRGGNPSAADRMLAIRLGVQSVKALCAGKSAKMVGILNNAVANTPMQNVVKQHVISDELQGLLSVFCR